MKPSSDYIDWMMAPERETFRRRLNEEWEPEVGDWIVTADDPKTPQIVTVSADEGVYRTAKTRRELWEYRQHIRWLPDLAQLLALLQQELAGPLLAMGVHYNEGKQPSYRAWSDDVETWRCEEEGAESWEVAVAKLLMKYWGLT